MCTETRSFPNSIEFSAIHILQYFRGGKFKYFILSENYTIFQITNFSVELHGLDLSIQ